MAQGGTFHSLRHFFATTLMSNGVEPQDVQRRYGTQPADHAGDLRPLAAEEGQPKDKIKASLCLGCAC